MDRDHRTGDASTARPHVTVLGPHPLLAIGIEPYPGASDEIHLHAAGQGVWVSRMAAALGAHPVLCGFLGGETGSVLAPMLAELPGEQRMISTALDTGAYVMDRRTGANEPVAHSLSAPPTRHELDDLAAATIASALHSRLLVLTNPFPAESLGPDFYEHLVTDLRPHGVKVLADLSTPRLEGALRGGLELVKINDWELAEFVSGSVEHPADLAAGARELMKAGAEMVVITRGERTAVVFRGAESWELAAPSFEHGFREGCGDSMMGAVAAVTARGGNWQEALTIGAAAGAANFLRRGLGTGDPGVITQLASAVTLRPLPIIERSATPPPPTQPTSTA